jgi:hypothetical protein
LKFISAILACLFVVGCGGGSMSPTKATSPTGAPPQPAGTTTITAAQVFQVPVTPTTWHFTGQNGCTMDLLVSAAPSTNFVPAGSMTWTTDKHSTTDPNATNCYWNPGTPKAHAQIVLAHQPDGSFSIIANLITFPLSCNFCTGGWTYMTQDVTSVGDGKTPYIIIPASATSGTPTTVDTSYLGYNLTGTDPSTLTMDSVIGLVAPVTVHLRTTATVEKVSAPSYTGAALALEIWEGPCFRDDGSYFAAPQCNHEKTFYAPGLAYIKNITFSKGDGELLLPDGSHNPIYDIER